MKHYLKSGLLPAGTVLFAAVAMAARYQLYRTGLDEKGLLAAGHPMETLLWLCTALAALWIVTGVLREKKPRRQFPPTAALGHILAASGIALTAALNTPRVYGPIGTAWKVTGFLAALLLVYAAFSLVMGKRPFFGAYAVVSVFFALHLVSHYQTWCADPQLQNYVFEFGGVLGLMLFGYYQSAGAAGRTSLPLLRLTGLFSAYFCLTALSGTSYLYLYAGSGLWALTGLCPPQKEGGADEPA